MTDASCRRSAAGRGTSRYIHITTPGKEKQAMERAARAMELQFDYYGPFGFGAVVARRGSPGAAMAPCVSRFRRTRKAGIGQEVARRVMAMQDISACSSTRSDGHSHFVLRPVS